MFVSRLIFFSLSIISLLSLASCGEKSVSRSSKEANPICTEIDCLSSATWKVSLQGRSFPEKAKVVINNETILNECLMKQKYSVDRSTSPESLKLESFFIPKRGELSIAIYDLGLDCNQESEFISEKDVQFDAVKTVEGQEILINL